MYFGQATTPSLDIRSSGLARTRIPAGSVVPLVRSRKPARRHVLTAAAAVRADRRVRAQLSALDTVLRLPVRTLAPMVAKFQALSGFGETDPDEMRELVESFRDALAEIEGTSSLTAGERDELGAHMLFSRAGDIGSSMGIDVAWQDLVGNASPEFARLYDRLSDDFEGVMNTTAFDHISAVFEDQGLGVSGLTELSSQMRSIYERFGVNDIVGDCTAFSEGGLRRLVEQAMGESPRWLTAENIRRLGGAAQDWVGAARSGEITDYLAAGGTSIAAIGAMIPQPAGAVVSAIGGLIVLISELFTIEAEDRITLPDVRPCEETFGLKPWSYNREAWTALAVWLCVKDGGDPEDSDIYREALADRVPIVEVASRHLWHATVDRYTGEVMVKPPSADPRHPTQHVRLLDLIDRDLLIPPDDPMRVIQWVQARGRRLLGFHPQTSIFNDVNPLWCVPSPSDIQTGFLGSVDSESSDVKRFRSPLFPSNIRKKVFESWNFWTTYAASMVVSMYAGGTVPFGVQYRPYGDDYGYYISSGVGGFSGMRKRRPLGVLQVNYCDGYAPCVRLDSSGRETFRDTYAIRLPFDAPSTRNTSVELSNVVSFEDFVARMRDDSWRLENRIPNQSPAVQIEPSDSVFRLHLARGAMELVRMQPSMMFKRDEATGMSGLVKAGLVLAGITVIGGITYAIYKRRS